MFKTRKAQLAILIDLHEELIRKIDKQIEGYNNFISCLENFFIFEKKMEQERWKVEQLDTANKKGLDNDRKY
jgi:hypothetical protein